MWFSENIEVFFPVWVVVGIVGSEAPAWEVLYYSLVEAFGEFVGLGLAFASVAAPACGVEPFGAVSGGVYVNTDQDDILLT